MDKIEELLTRGVANIIPSKIELEKSLKSGKKLNIYLGIDPTATKIHLGHAVVLRRLQHLVELGHNVTFLIGDFTALIGDTSDKDKERPVLTYEEIKKNFQTYKQQARKILDFSKVKIRHNSEWLKKLDFTKITSLCQVFSLNDFISRDLIRKRLDDKRRVGLHEILYPVMQGYDSYFMDTDIQLGGADQTFNMQAGRTLQKILRDKESFILTTSYLEGTDGRKMSKSWGNAIWLDDEPNDVYAKVMAIKDTLIVNYYILATNVSLHKINEIKQKLQSEENLMILKKDLAYRIVSELYNVKTADKAAEYFEKVVQKQHLPEDIPVYQYTGKGEENIISLLTQTGLVKSKSESKRLVEQSGVTIGNQIVSDPNLQIKIKNGMIIKVGKRKFVKMRISP